MPVGSKPLGDSVSGVSDLSGNVWEWTRTQVDNHLVLRGGSWDYENKVSLSAHGRIYLVPYAKSLYYGFRCVSELSP
jgi:formylglycine-generating enzyme required for sulfatase activity